VRSSSVVRHHVHELRLQETCRKTTGDDDVWLWPCPRTKKPFRWNTLNRSIPRDTVGQFTASLLSSTAALNVKLHVVHISVSGPLRFPAIWPERGPRAESLSRIAYASMAEASGTRANQLPPEGLNSLGEFFDRWWAGLDRLLGAVAPVSNTHAEMTAAASWTSSLSFTGGYSESWDSQTSERPRTNSVIAQ